MHVKGWGHHMQDLSTDGNQVRFELEAALIPQATEQHLKQRQHPRDDMYGIHTCSTYLTMDTLLDLVRVRTHLRPDGEIVAMHTASTACGTHMSANGQE